MKESIYIHGLEESVPEEAEEQINDAIHNILRENHGITPDAVSWAYPEEEQ